MGQRVITDRGDKDGSEQDIFHMAVEEVYPVVWTWHQRGHGAARVVSLGALDKWIKRVSTQSATGIQVIWIPMSTFSCLYLPPSARVSF